MRFAAAADPVRWFWSSGDAWGTVRQAPGPEGTGVELAVLGGELPLRRLELDGAGGADLERPRTLRRGETAAVRVPPP
ncbi:MAG: hypothetical protein AVDCRST_MAG19-2979 [uncultured Thermomicrobiales bacterium]|uniref:Uncharacterized protein n=1 Tax=uncultured Thermomicrobiales bacterium TaxID=1645740 RepID=A0A6J4VC01_9BACT|nr:MAG: hypothetical protein AVDCRST_MAG19-2979 [uncultured Thermomicrobiales bacterium]